jgi:hypothetical protein
MRTNDDRGARRVGSSTSQVSPTRGPAPEAQLAQLRGAAVESHMAQMRSAAPEASDDLYSLIRRTRGHFFLASCSDSQPSYEMEDVKHGVFTYYLIQALSGKAAADDGQVTLESVYGYVKQNLRDWATQNAKQVMQPFINVDSWNGNPLVLGYTRIAPLRRIMASATATPGSGRRRQ